MHATPATPLLIAALIMLRAPCARNQAHARLLLERASTHKGLSQSERETCRQLAEELDIEQYAHAPRTTRNTSTQTTRILTPVTR